VNLLEEVVICSTQDLTEFIKMLSEKQLLSHTLFEQANGRCYLKIDDEMKKPILTLLAEWILYRQGHRLLQHKLQTQCWLLDSEEMLAVKELALQHFLEKKQEFLSRIYQKILYFTKITKFFNLDGFFNFYLFELDYDITELVEDCIDEFYSKEVYRDFMNLLHYFIENSSSQSTHLIVVTSPNGTYEIYDELKRNITNDCLWFIQEEFPEMDEEAPEKQNDLLMSLLFILVPESITIYGTEYIKNKNFIQTLKELFASRIRCYKKVPAYFSIK